MLKLPIKTVCALSMVSTLQGAIIFSSNGNNLTLTITEAIEFEPPANTAGGIITLVLEDVFSTPQTTNYVTQATTGTATLSDDQGNSHATGISPGIGYGNFNQGALDPNDLVFGFEEIGDPLFIAANSTVTLSAGTFTFIGPSVPVLPDVLTPTTITLADNDINPVAPSKTITFVPEPSSILLMGLGGFALSLRRSRRL